MRTINQYTKAIVKTLLPIVLVIFCETLFAGTTGDTGLDKVVKGVKDTTSGGWLAIGALGAVVVGVFQAYMQTSILPLGITAVILVGGKLLLGYSGTVFTLLI